MSSKFSCFVITLLFVPLFIQCKALQLLEQQPQATQKDVNNTISETTSLVRLIYFTPQDRPFKQRIADQIQLQMETVQTFFADQMDYTRRDSTRTQISLIKTGRSSAEVPPHSKHLSG